MWFSSSNSPAHFCQGVCRALAIFPLGRNTFSFTSDSFNQAVCSWNIDRLLHKPSHSGQDAENSLTPFPSCLKQLLHCWTATEDFLESEQVSCPRNVSAVESTGWIQHWEKTKTTVLPILMICLDVLGPNAAGQIITSTFLEPCDSVFSGKTRAHSFGLAGQQHQVY